MSVSAIGSFTIFNTQMSLDWSFTGFRTKDKANLVPED